MLVHFSFLFFGPVSIVFFFRPLKFVSIVSVAAPIDNWNSPARFSWKKTKKKTKTNRYENENKIKDRKKKKHSAFIDLGGVFVDQIEKKRWTNCDAADGEFQVEKLFSNPDTESTLKKK